MEVAELFSPIWKSGLSLFLSLYSVVFLPPYFKLQNCSEEQHFSLDCPGGRGSVGGSMASPHCSRAMELISSNSFHDFPFHHSILLYFLGNVIEENL